MDKGGFDKKLKIYVITFPQISKYRGEIQVSKKFINLLNDNSIEAHNFSDKIDNSRCEETNRRIRYFSQHNILDGLIEYLFIEIKYSYIMLKNKDRINTILFLGWLPVIMSLVFKILNRKIILVVHTSAYEGVLNAYKNTIFGKGGIIFSNIINILQVVNFYLADLILFDYELLAKQNSKYIDNNKIAVASSIFIETDIFKQTKSIDERDSIVGYVGRLSEEKGVSNFIEAIPSIIKKNPHIKFLIIGDGPLNVKLVNYISKAPANKIKFLGWIPHNELPTYLNEIKLLILPSYIEGLPNILLEAMACGTPVLATSVGAISSLIVNEDTGFILVNNSPDIISEKILECVNHKKLEFVSENARNHINRNYSKKNASKISEIIHNFLIDQESPKSGST